MNSFLETLRQLGAARLAIMGGVLVGLLIFFIFITLRISAPDMAVVYNDLSTVDSSAIAAELEGAQIPYEISNDGSVVSVPENEVGRARMLLAESGLPNGGSMGYEIFDKQSGFGTTNFVQNLNQIRALEGELSRTIAALDPIQTARVHLVLPQRELFSRESRPASGSVFLNLKPAEQVTKEQVRAIQSLVASSVPQMKASNVSVIDSEGNLLARGSGEDSEFMSTSNAEEMRRNYELRLVNEIEDMVGRIVGYGRVRASVNAELNFDRISTNEELYDPEQQVVRSTQVIEESSNESEGADSGSDISIENNLPGLDAAGGLGTGPSAESSRVEEVTNFEIGKTIRNMVREVGEVQRLSVAVLVDGKYVPAEPEVGEDGEPVETSNALVYQPRSDEELDRIATLVRSAIGFDSERGDILEVVNERFASVDAGQNDPADLFLGFEKDDLLESVELIIVAIMIVLVVLLVLQPMVSRLIASDSLLSKGGKGGLHDGDSPEYLQSPNVKAALAAPKLSEEEFKPPEIEEQESLINMEQVEGKVKASTIKKVEDIVDNYPNETVSVIRNWMTE